MIIIFSNLELPWDQPSLGCAEYVKWKSNDTWTVATPWTKLDTLALSLLRKILEPMSSKRIDLTKIVDHKWCRTQFRTNGKFLLQFPRLYIYTYIYYC